MPFRLTHNSKSPTSNSRSHRQNFPDQQYPSIVGRPILRSEERGDIVVKDIMCGDEAAAARSMLQISYPVRSPYDVHSSISAPQPST